MAANVDEVISGPPARGPLVLTDYQQTPDLGKFAAALAKAQGEMHNALKDSKNPHFNSAFADLESVVEAIKGPLATNEIARLQFPLSREGGEVGVRTQLIHSSGQWVAATVWCKAERPGPQALGSVITYLRRYSLAAAAGVAPADDDGEAAEGRGNGGASKPAPRASAPPSRQQAEGQTKALDRALRLQKLLTDKEPNGCGWPIPKCKNWLRKHFHVDVSTDLSEEQLKDGELLALAQIEGGDLAYRNELQRLIAAGRVFGEVA